MEQIGSHRKNFHEILYLIIFQNSAEKIQDSLKLEKNNLVFHTKANIHFWSYPAEFFLDWEKFTQMLYRKSINRFFFNKWFLRNHAI